MQLTGSEIVIECLKEQGVDTVFGYPGGAILNVYDALNNVEVQEIKRVEDVLNADKSARQYVLDSVK